jgi:hypothetical protein
MEPTAGERPHTTPRLLPVTLAANGRDCEGLKVATAGVTTTEEAGTGLIFVMVTAVPVGDEPIELVRVTASAVMPGTSVPVTVASVPLGIMLELSPAAIQV